MSTLVQIKRSTSNVAPGSLLEGELAYSYVSNVIFIGDTAGGVMNIGGQFYTDLIDNASAANGASTFVRRYANGTAQFAQLDVLVEPTENTHVATKSYVDGAITGNVSLNTLTDVTVVGDATAQNNRILIGHANGEYITTDVTGNVSIANDGIITIGSQQVVGSMLADTLVGNKTFANTITIGEDLTITGNLYVQGNTTTVDVETLIVEDSLIKLANNNSSDTVDIGFYGVYNSTSYAGLFRDATDGNFKLFTDYAGADPTGNTIGAVSRATLEANLSAQYISTDTANVNVSLGVGNLFATNANVSGKVNISSDLWVGGNTYVVQNANIVGSLNVQSAVWLSTLELGAALGVGSGGTGHTSFTANGVFFADTVNSLNFATGTEGQVLQISAGVPAFGMLDGGSF